MTDVSSNKARFLERGQGAILPSPERGDAASADRFARTMQSRVRDWIRALHRDPSAEERAMEERRARLLEELNRAVAEESDDVPIRQIIHHLNHHPDD